MTAESTVTFSRVDSFLREETRFSTNPLRDTCAIIGTAYKGPAFVPKNLTSMGVEKPEGFGANLNSFARYFGDPTGSLNVTSNARLAADQWFTGVDKQVSFIRVLGAGDGKKTNVKGIVEKSGFIVGNEQVSGSSNHGKISSNVYANTGSVLGRTFFLGGFYYQNTGSTTNPVAYYPLTQSFEQLGLTGIDGIFNSFSEDVNGKNIYPIINGILMFPSGVVPGLNVAGATDSLNGNEVAKGFYGASGDKGQHIGSGSLISAGDVEHRKFRLYLNGHKAAASNFIDFNFNDTDSAHYYKNVFNKDPLKIAEKGHLLYASYDPAPGFHYGLKHLDSGYTTFILSSSLDRNTSDVNTPNFEDFRARYRTASTPWIVSQTFSLQNTNRNNLVDKSNDLFKFYSRTDGAAGNNDVYIVIQPTELGKDRNIISTDPGKDYSSFKVIVVDYKSNKILEKFVDCNLNPDSPRYIAKVIGTQHEYYNWEIDEDKQKIVSKGTYLNQSQYIRVEMHEDVEKGFIPKITMPSGFRGYRHLVTEIGGNSLLTNIADFTNDQGNILSGSLFTSSPIQSFIPKTIQLKSQNSNNFKAAVDNLNELSENDLIQNPMWGVNKNFKIKYDKANDRVRGNIIENITVPGEENEEFYCNFNNVNSLASNTFDFSLFLPDASQDGVPASWAESNSDASLDADLYNNNMFHLEKIIVHTGSGDLKEGHINWNLASYRRDGKDLNTMPENTLMHSNFAQYFNINDDLNVLSGSILDRDLKIIADANASHLAFSVYLAGGFDGTNIFDADKSNFTSDACVREENDELLDGGIVGPTIISYDKAANLIKDENLLFRDIVCMPGIESDTLRKKSATFASEEKTYLYVQDIPLSDYNYNIVTGSKSDYMANFASGSGEDKVILEATAEAHKRNHYFSAFNASYFGEQTTTLLQGLPGGNVFKVVPPSVTALGKISTTVIGQSPSGIISTIGSAPSVIIQDFNVGSDHTDTLRSLYRSRDINVIALKSEGLSLVSARTEDDVKPSLSGAVGTRRARSEIRKRIREMTLREFLFDNYSATIDSYVIRYDRRVSQILQEYVTAGVLSSFKTNINSRNMSAEDLQNGIFRGSVSMVFAGRRDIGSGREDVIELDDIIGSFERLVN